MYPVTTNKRNMIVCTLEVIEADTTTYRLNPRSTVPELLMQISTHSLVKKRRHFFFENCNLFFCEVFIVVQFFGARDLVNKGIDAREGPLLL